MATETNQKKKDIEGKKRNILLTTLIKRFKIYIFCHCLDIKINHVKMVDLIFKGIFKAATK